MLDITIYWISGSAPAWRVLLFLEAKQLQYRSRVLETSRKEQKEDWFLALNPRGQIPLLVDGDVKVCESLAIMHYLERAYTEPPLLGGDPGSVAAVEQTLHEVMSYVDGPIGDIVQPVFRNKIESNWENMQLAADKVKAELANLEHTLAERPWLVGDDYCAADIVLVPTWQRFLRALNKAPDVADTLGFGDLEQHYPGLSAWNRKIVDRPDFDKTFPPHWRTS